MAQLGYRGYGKSVLYWCFKDDKHLAQAMLTLYAVMLRESAREARGADSGDGNPPSDLHLGAPSDVCATLRRALATDLTLLLELTDASHNTGTLNNGFPAPPPPPPSSVAAVITALLKGGTLHSYSQLLSAAIVPRLVSAPPNNRDSCDLDRALELLLEFGELLRGLAGAVLEINGILQGGPVTWHKEAAGSHAHGAGGSSSSSGGGPSPAHQSDTLAAIFASQLAASHVLEHAARLVTHVVKQNRLDAEPRRKVAATLRGLSAALDVLTRRGWVAPARVAEVTSGCCLQWLMLGYSARLYGSTAAETAVLPSLPGVPAGGVRMPMWSPDGKVLRIVVPPPPPHPVVAPRSAAAAAAAVVPPPPSAPPEPQYASAELVVQSLRVWRARLAAATAASAAGGDGGDGAGPLVSQPDVIPHRMLMSVQRRKRDSSILEPGLIIAYAEFMVLEPLLATLETAPGLPPGTDCLSVAAQAVSEAMRALWGAHYPPQHWAYEGGALALSRKARMLARVLAAMGQPLPPLEGLFRGLLDGTMYGTPIAAPLLQGAAPSEVLPRLVAILGQIMATMHPEFMSLHQTTTAYVADPANKDLREQLTHRSSLVAVCDRLGPLPGQTRLLFGLGMRMARLGAAHWGCPAAEEAITRAARKAAAAAQGQAAQAAAAIATRPMAQGTAPSAAPSPPQGPPGLLPSLPPPRYSRSRRQPSCCLSPGPTPSLLASFPR